ncbi:hypothetical protein BYT27DRAFT_7141469 [Phlegmacium glaucopus]|nr:hypothetical protein BYT27DRAFT_7141469 [Phlegmacium glaucopus]
MNNLSMQTSTASTLCSATTPTTKRPPPRYKRFGGFPVTRSIAIEWASRIYGETLDEDDTYLIRKSILDKFRQYGINFLQIGEGGVDWMVVTQYTPFKGYQGMSSSHIPVFEEGPKDAVARRVLDEEGIFGYEFKTVLG